MSGSDKTALGDRMKAYEDAYRVYLPRRVPILLRVDGKAFHTLTKHCERPWYDRLCAAMDAVALALCEEIQGAQLAYVQSDEVSVLIHGYRTITSEPWLNNGLQKIVSVSASVATAAFNDAYRSSAVRWLVPAGTDLDVMDGNIGIIRYVGPNCVPELAPTKSAHFDSRAFMMPEDEVANYFLWRQRDAERNSIQMLARAHFSHTECHKKSCVDLQDMLHTKGVNWNDCPTVHKRGRCAVRADFERDGTVRSGWVIDKEIPMFGQDRAYVERHVNVHKEAA
jgi:tRNA(His) 5'-end guanylyltransferase